MIVFVIAEYGSEEYQANDVIGVYSSKERLLLAHPDKVFEWDEAPVKFGDGPLIIGCRVIDNTSQYTSHGWNVWQIEVDA